MTAELVSQSRPRSDQEHAALRELLQAAKRAEAAATGSHRRDAYRNTRSLIGAARELGFTLPALASMLEVTVGSARSRTGPPLQMLPSTFLTLAPTPAAAPLIVGIGDFGYGSECTISVVDLLRWYLVGTSGDDRAA